MRIGDKRLLELADFVEKQAPIEKSQGRPGFDMAKIISWYCDDEGRSCSSPSCLLGFAMVLFEDEVDEELYDDMPIPFFDLSLEETNELFSRDGCDNAGKGVAKAVAYVRNFVARRNR